MGLLSSWGERPKCSSSGGPSVPPGPAVPASGKKHKVGSTFETPAGQRSRKGVLPGGEGPEEEVALGAERETTMLNVLPFGMIHNGLAFL